MPSYYPVYLDLHDKPVVVVGGGVVAERKVLALLECDAKVTVVSPQLTPGLQALAAAGRITAVRRPYASGDLADAALAIVGTDDTATNRTAAREARNARVLVNSVDDIDYCDFIAPAVIRRGDLTVALSTNGKSPAMARWAREELETILTPDYGDLLRVLEQVRLNLRQQKLQVTPDDWQASISQEVRDLVRQGKLEEAEAFLFDALQQMAVNPTEPIAVQEGAPRS